MGEKRTCENYVKFYHSDHAVTLLKQIMRYSHALQDYRIIRNLAYTRKGI